MKAGMYVFFIVIALLAVWTVISALFGSSVASPEYTVVEEKSGYEIRAYTPYITAQVTVTGTYDEALNKGFRILADYIFGNNTKQTSIAMTAPVTEGESEKMAMTAPVIESANSETTRIISFVMPFEYTLDTLPQPNNNEVKIVEQPARKVAVHRFSWWRSGDRVAHKKQVLLDLLERDSVVVKGSLEYAGYNAPFTAPWLNRNEVMVEIE